jgi:mono/diheme cytochrome c family protein/Spy/CpxP family protein refolding chaperone
MKTLKAILLSLGALVLVALGLVYAGAINVAADVPHSAPVLAVLELARERSVAVRARGVEVPNLDDPALIAAGAGHYAAMCTGCHLAPGMADTEIRKGLYPKPPNLAEHGAHDPAKAFWVIKHGIKMTAMPAWGATHDDDSIWGLVAFVAALPGLDADGYRKLGAGSGHSHSHGDSSDTDDHADADGSEATHAHAHAGSGADHEAGMTGVAASAKDPVEAVERLQSALAMGDFATVDRLLDPAVTIYESGGVERSRAEYAAGHRGHDAAFLAKARIELLAQSGDADGDLAWVASERRIAAGSDAEPVTLASLETAVLRRSAGQWRIVHIHWSSRKPADRSAASAPLRDAAPARILPLGPIDAAALARGDGMGFAKAAERNGYPGPKHVLELADALALTSEQRAHARRLFEAMQREARALGGEYLEALATLESGFRDRRIDLPTLRAQTRRLGVLEGRLRDTHLQAHLAMSAVLESQQRARYRELRQAPARGT